MKIQLLKLVLATVAVLFTTFACATRPGTGQPQRAAASQKRILVMTKCSGFVHGPVKRRGDQLSVCEQVMTELGGQHGWQVTCTKDASLINADNLKKYDAVVFYTSGELTEPGTDKQPPMTDQERRDLLEFVRNGGGFMGWHSATDTFHQWEENGVKPYIDMIGAEFTSHGAQFVGTVRVVDKAHPIMKRQPADFTIMEEWYLFTNFNKKAMHVLALLDTSSERAKQDKYNIPSYPITWCSTYGTGRVFYSGLGHGDNMWRNEVFQNLAVDAVKWACGETPADAMPNYDQCVPESK